MAVKVFATKYALTQGIQEMNVEPAHVKGYVVTCTAYANTLKLGRDVHYTKEAAVTQAERMRNKRMTALRRELDRLEKLRF